MADMQASVALMLSAAVVTVGGISGTQNAMLLLSFDAPTLSLVRPWFGERAAAD
jgi:hypothetical protein